MRRNADEVRAYYNSRRKPTGGFNRWLWDQCGRSDPVGDLAYDFVLDSDWIKNPTKFGQGMAYLRHCHACDGAEQAYRRAWREYCGEYWGRDWPLWLEEASSLLHPEKVKGCIYFIYASEVYKYKVGRATNVQSRFSSIQTASPVLLELTHTIGTDDPKYLEAIFHRLYHSYQVHGEWFSLDEQQVEQAENWKFIDSSLLKTWEKERLADYDGIW